MQVKCRFNRGNAYVLCLTAIDKKNIYIVKQAIISWAGAQQTCRKTWTPSLHSDQSASRLRLISVFYVRMQKILVLGYPITRAPNKCSDVQMSRLIGVFAWRTYNFTEFAGPWINFVSTEWRKWDDQDVCQDIFSPFFKVHYFFHPFSSMCRWFLSKQQKVAKMYIG